MKVKLTFVYLLIHFTSFIGNSQSISRESIEFELLKEPKIQVPEAQRTLKVTVTSPYNLTSDDVIAQSKVNFQNDVKNYDKVLEKSQVEFQQKLKDYDFDVIKVKEKFLLESAEFKKLSFLERMSMTEQGKNPKMREVIKPEYYKPSPPIYVDPNLNDYIILNNSVLSGLIKIDGFSREGNFVEVIVDIQKLTFQDNAGQTFANQPTKIKIFVNGAEKLNSIFFQDYKFVSASPSNNINKPLTEKTFLNDVIKFLNNYLNDNLGYQSIKYSTPILSVKNKGKYDDLERADIMVKTNLRKLNPQNLEMTKSAMDNLNKVLDTWKQTLAQVDYKEKKSLYNARIGQFLYFNVIRLNLALGNKVDAEKYLNEMQNNMIYMDLSYDEKNELKTIENEIYKKK